MGPVEFSLRIFALTDTLSQELAALEKEGWKPLPGLAPAVTYVVFRPAVQAQEPASTQQAAPAGAGRGGISIDETKVMVIRDGKEVSL